MIAAYCSCGGSFQATSRPPEHEEVIAEMFSTLHRGQGHESIDKETYAANRERRRKV